MAEIDGRKAALIAELEICRTEVRSSLANCGRSLNIVERMRGNLRSNILGWSTAAGAAGALLVWFLRSRGGGASRAGAVRDDGARAVPNRAALSEILMTKAAGVLFSLASDFVRPAITAWMASFFEASAGAGRRNPPGE
jgi:hypothetical protein